MGLRRKNMYNGIPYITPILSGPETAVIKRFDYNKKCLVDKQHNMELEKKRIRQVRCIFQ